MIDTDGREAPGPVLLESGERVRVLTFNRPHRKNAFDVALWTSVADTLERIADDPDVAVVVLTGAGGAFSAGQDLAEMEAMSAIEGENPPARLMRVLLGYPKPLIAAVNGVAVGFGLSLVAHCDLAVVGRSARFKAPFVEIGLSADGAASAVLPEKMGWANAAHLLLTASFLSGPDAVGCGLAWRCVPDEEVLTEVLDVAGAIAAHPTEAVVATKALLVAARVDAWRRALAREEETFASLSQTDAHRAAVAAFLGRP